MENSNFKNATIQYAKFVQSSSHTEMKAIFDTFIPFSLFKECLDKKEKNEQMKILDEKRKKEASSKILLKEIQKEFQIKSNTNTKKKSNNKYSGFEGSEKSEEDSEKSEDPFDLTKDYEKIFNFNLITDEEKDEFRKGKPFPYLNTSLINIINKKNKTGNNIPKHEEFNFQLLSFKFKDSSLMRCPKVCFQQNAPLFESTPIPPQQSNPVFSYNNSENNSLSESNNNLVVPTISKNNNANNGQNNNNKLTKIKTISSSKNGNNKNNTNKKCNKYKSQKIKNNNISNNSSDIEDDLKEDNKIKDKYSQREDDEVINSLEKNSIAKESDLNSFKNKSKSGEIKYRNYKKYNTRSKILQIETALKPHFYFKTEEGANNKFIICDPKNIKDKAIEDTIEPYLSSLNNPAISNKIAIPSDDLRKELFIFDPINIELVKGNLNSFINEESLKKRAKLLFPYRQNFMKIIIIKLLQFLFIIKSKIANKKSLKVSSLLTSNGKMKLKEIRGSNIITFNEVKSFMESKFGHFHMNVFREAFEKKIQKNEEIKRTKKLEELQKKFLDILQKDDADRPEYEEDENMRNERRRNDANPMDIEKDSKMLLGTVYRPRKKMNYLNGLKMLIKEEAMKNKGNNYKYQ